MNRRIFLLLVPVVVAFAAAFFLYTPSAHAQDPDTPLTVNDVAEDLYCPLCSGLTVDVCELEVCADMRGVIAEKIAAGESEADIQAYFVQQYGQKVVAKPGTSGFDLAAWILPFAAIGLGIVGLVFWLSSRTKAAAHLAPVSETTPSSDPYSVQLDRELARLDE